MVDEKQFDYESYIQKCLKEIDDLDERRFAKEMLLESIGKMFAWTEEKYAALERRIANELDVPWKYFNVFTTIIDKKDYDPINHFWFPVCEADIDSHVIPEKETIYFMADGKVCKEFLKQGTLIGTEKETGREICFEIKKADRYLEKIKRLYFLFNKNHLPWQTIQMGHYERFFDLIPTEETEVGTDITFQWGKWEPYVKMEMIPLWNIQKTALYSREFRIPCMDEVFYEHIFYVSDGQMGRDGYLVETEDDILSIRYEENKLLLKTETEALDNIFIYRLCQEKTENSFGYRYPVLSNQKRDDFAARYLHQTGNFIQTPMELYRKIEELSGDCQIKIIGYEITDHADKMAIRGDMNDFIGGSVFPKDKRNILLFRIRREAEQQENYLYEAQVRYVLSQLQMEYFEYRCMGVFV